MNVNMKLAEGAIAPKKATEGAAAFDLHSVDRGIVVRHSAATFDTGVSVEVPKGYALLIFARSGNAFKRGLSLVNGVGVIDSDYRGTIKVGLRNHSPASHHIRVGDRVAQGMFIRTEDVEFTQVDELDTTDRGDGGLGSTGL